MYGEKVEEAQELRMDLFDIKDLYKSQVTRTCFDVKDLYKPRVFSFHHRCAKTSFTIMVCRDVIGNVF